MSTPTEVDVDQLPPTQTLILEVLAARHRLGETWWPFPTNCAPAIRKLAAAGLVMEMHGVVEHTLRARLTDTGRQLVVSGNYVSPMHRPIERVRALATAAQDAGTTLLPSQILTALGQENH